MYNKTDLYIVFKIPSRGRPDDLFRCIDSVINNLNNTKDCRILITADYDDDSMYCNELKQKYMEYCQKGVLINMFYDDATTKVGAYNRDVEKVNFVWDIIVVLDDQTEVVLQGFDDLIRSCYKATKKFRDNQMFFIGSKQRSVITMGRAYYRRFKYFYHPEYRNTFYARKEIATVSRLLKSNNYLYADIFKNHKKMDALKILNRSYNDIDKQVYTLRKAMRWGLG